MEETELETTQKTAVDDAARNEEVKRLLKLLDERSSQLVTLGAEEKRLRLLLRSSDAKLSHLRQTFEELEDRLKNKSNGRSSLDTQFNTLNALYSDLLLKYRTLSDEHEEVRS